MLRKFLGTAAVATLVCVSVVMADDVKGKITKVDPDKKVITVTTDGKDTEYTVADDCKMPKQRMGGKGKGGGGGGGDAKDMTLKDLQAAVDRAKDRGGYAAVVTVEKKSGKEQVTEIKSDRPARGGDKPKPKDPDKDKTTDK
jgi:hypothetical protein